MKKIKYLLVAAALMVSSASFGQQFHLSGTLQNMHLWRGLQIADGGVLAADVSMGLFKDRLKIGLWGGTDFTGDYKEFDYYLSYSASGFTVAVWDIFNYSPDLTFSKDIFNYNKYSTGHFLDLSVAYDFDTKLEVPLRLYWATIFAGRDLNSAGNNMYSTLFTGSIAYSGMTIGSLIWGWVAPLPLIVRRLMAAVISTARTTSIKSP